MGHYKKLIGKKCYLSPAEPEDGDLIARWYNDGEISAAESNVYMALSAGQVRERVQTMIDGGDTSFIVVDLATDRPVGMVDLEANLVFGNATLGIVIGEKEIWGRGYAREAILLILDFAFNALNLHNVMLGVYAFNTRAVRLYRSIGFKEIGRKREYMLMAGQRVDMIMMDILSTEYESVYLEGVLKGLAREDGDGAL